MRFILRIAMLLLAFGLFGLAASVRESAAQDSAPPESGAAPAAERVEVKVLSFNIWRGGSQVSLDSTLRAIRESGADIVLLQEAEGQTRAIADALDWPYASEPLALLSRFPIFEAPGNGPLFGYLEVRPGGFVAVANIHLPSDPYGPYAARNGESADALLALETETRLPVIQPFLEVLPPLAAATGLPVIMAGDFNSPSHLDWTGAMVGQRPQIKFPLEWPVSSAVAAAGFTDSYRAAHPDPATDPGLTWTAGYPSPYLAADEVMDRIDFIHVLGAEVKDSQIVGEAGGPGVDLAVMPWPSDHRAVLSTLALSPAPAPALVSFDQRRIPVGQLLPVRYHAATPDGRIEDGQIVLVPQGADADQAVRMMPTNDSTDRLSLALLGTAGLPPGAYDALLLDVSGSELARATCWLVERDAPVDVTVDRASYLAGEPIAVTWSGAPGNRADWIGLYPVGEIDPFNYLAYLYTGATVGGSALFDEEAIGGQLEPGSYEVRLLLDDGYAALAVSQPFTIGQ